MDGNAVFVDKVIDLISVVNEYLDVFKNNILLSIIIPFIGSMIKRGVDFLRVYFSKIILGTVRDINSKGERRKSFFMLLNSYKFLLPLVIWWGTLFLFSALLMCFQLAYENNTGIMLIVLLSLLILCTGLRCQLGKKCLGKVQMLMLLMLFNIYSFFMVISYSIHINSVNYLDKFIYIVLAMMTTINYGALNGRCIRKILLEKNNRIKCLKLIKEVCLVTFLFGLLVNMIQGAELPLGIEMNIYFIIWITICVIEWIVDANDKSTAVGVEVALLKENVFTKNKIVQYKPNKIKVICENGSTKIVDNKEVKHIKYYLYTDGMKKVTKKVLYIPYSGTSEEYHDYKYLSSEWVLFCRYSEKTCEVVLVPDRCVKEIIVE